MPRKIEVVLEGRGVRAVADLLDDEAPKTCQAVWDALPQSGPTYHAKWANNEVYILTPPFASGRTRARECHGLPHPRRHSLLLRPAGEHRAARHARAVPRNGVIDLAIFYGRNNYLHGPAGHMPGNIFAIITEGLPELAAACQDLWRNGAGNERMTFRRLEE